MLGSSEPSRPVAAADRAGVAGLVQPAAPLATEWQLRRVAREVHDVVGGALVAARIVIDRLERDLGPHEAIGAARAVLDVAILDVRAFLRDVATPTFAHGDLVAELRHLVSAHAAIGTFVGRVRRHPLDSGIPLEIEFALYRIAQEAFTNVARHADATFVDVDLRQRRRMVELTISDDGRGFDPAADATPSTSDRLGLRTMEERAQLLGGTLTIRSQPGKGTLIRSTIPIPSASIDAPADTTTLVADSAG